MIDRATRCLIIMILMILQTFWVFPGLIVASLVYIITAKHFYAITLWPTIIAMDLVDEETL